MMEIIDRHTAHGLGKNRYYTGRPCKRGHVCERQVTNGGCVQCMTLRLIPTVAAHNVGTPPSPYAFAPDVTVTPELLSYVHARVLRDALPVYVREFQVLRPQCDLAPMTPPVSVAAAVLAKLDKLRKPVPLKGADLAKMHKAGWTDAQLLSEGFAEWEYPRL